MKMERVYREVLWGVLENKTQEFKQLELSKLCNLSLSTVNYALKPLERMNAIEKMRFGLRVVDPKKILLYWASIRNLEKEVIYQTYLDEPVARIESEVPGNSVFTAYSAFKFKFGNTPSDYGEVVVYGNREDFTRRFGNEKVQVRPNLIVLGLDSHLARFKVAPIAQIFVDLWNLRAWYARDFLKKLEEIIDGILE
ncbi:MAG: winged helix-turn-helix domain-containing protein [Candidatus Bathyarchaeia archaeon]